jgi:hypothetical protein
MVVGSVSSPFRWSCPRPGARVVVGRRRLCKAKVLRRVA